MGEPIFGQEAYNKWFVPQPMSKEAKAAFDRKQREKAAHENKVLITANSGWIVFNEFYPDALAKVRPSSLNDGQILLAQRMLKELVEGRTAFQVVSAFAQSVLYKRPSGLAGFGLIIANFVRKLPSDAFAHGTPSEASVAALIEDSDIKALIGDKFKNEFVMMFPEAGPVRLSNGSFFFPRQ